MKEVLGDIESLVKEAEKALKRGEKFTAASRYQTAGRIALYEGKKDETIQYLEKAEELGTREILILKEDITDKALEKAQEYYALKEHQ